VFLFVFWSVAPKFRLTTCSLPFSHSSYFGREYVRVVNPTKTLWYLGVYAREASEVQVRVEIPTASTTGGLVPQPPPLVENSQTQSSQSGGAWAVPVLVVVLVVLAFTCVVGGYLLYRRKFQGRRSLMAIGQRDWTDLVDQEESDSAGSGSDLGVVLEDSTESL
jgi:hypothetical protein